ncbi:MAG: response regulator [Planctomycetota bacterium]|nr:response regulator [Planctomycetota bacterium]
MTRILVAEDSATQAVQIRGLLEREHYQVDLVSDGKQALRRLTSGEKPDLILTDMMMPEMDGLDLVKAVRVHHTSIPVILMTAQGTDALAIEALEEGAASYVSKSQLSQRLIDEIERVLHAARVDRSYEMLLGSLLRNEFIFELPNDVALFDPLVDLLQQMMVGMKLCDSTGRVRVGVALEHALLNALYRGNLEISPAEMQACRELLVQGGGADLVEQRRSQLPYRDRRIHLHVRMSTDEARFVIRDEGPGFDTVKLPKLSDPDSLAQTGGRGLLLMQTFMDEVTFNDQGNEVTMVKRRDVDRSARG